VKCLLGHAAAAARTNFLPGLLLQAVMLAFLAAYLFHDGARAFLEHVAIFKQQVGFGFAFVSYAIAAGTLPELLRIVFFQNGKITRTNLWRIVTGGVIWGVMGIIVDVFYRLQGDWFGNNSDWQTIAAKVLVDQLAFSPFLSSPYSVSLLTWRDRGFKPSALRDILRRDFFFDHVFPVQVAGWCVWIPGVCLVYFMPAPLQLPTAVTIQVFWVLIFTTVSERLRSPVAAPGVSRSSVESEPPAPED
jgi:hypothetical protein